MTGTLRRATARLLVTGLLCAAGLWGAARATAAAGDPPQPACAGAIVDVDLAGFGAALDDLARDVSDAGSPDQARAIGGRLPACWRVRDGGRVVIAPADWIHRDVAAASAAPRDWTARRATLSRRIAAVRRDAAAWAAAPTRPGGGEARAALDAILAEAEFRGAGHETWRTSVGRHIREWIDAKLQALAGRRLAWEFVGRLLAWAAALGALVTLAVAAWRLQWSRTVPLSLESAPPRLTSHEWAARARTAIAAGDRREAVRCAYHAALFRLEELGAWRVDPTRTPREYLSLLPREDARRGIVGDLTRDFERAWYGGDTPDTHGLAAQLEGLGCHASSDRAI